MPQLQIKISIEEGREESKRFTAENITIGRDKKCGIVLADRDVSRTHSMIYFEEQRWRIKDMESTNGTFVNGVPVKERALKEEDVVIVGKSRLQIIECLVDEDDSMMTTQAGVSNFRLIHELEPAAEDALVGLREAVAEGVADSRQLEIAVAILQLGGAAFSSLLQDERAAQSEQALSEELPGKIVNSVLELFPELDFCALRSFDPRVRDLELKATTATDDNALELEKKLVVMALEGGRAALAEIRLSAAAEDAGRMLIMCTPLMVGDECRGFLYAAQTSESECLTPLDLELFCLYARQAASLLESMKARLSQRHDREKLLAMSEQTPLIQSQLLELDRHHQLNTVASVSIGELQTRLLKMEQLSLDAAKEIPRAHAARKSVEELNAVAKKTLERCQNLLTYSRRGKIQIHRFHPTKLIAEVVELTKNVLSDNVWLESNLPEHLPLVEFDALLFEQFLIQALQVCQDSMIEGGMIKLTAAKCQLDEDLIAANPEMSPGPGISLSIAVSGGLPLAVGDDDLRELAAGSDGTAALARLYDVIAAGGGLMDLERLSDGSRINLYLQRTETE